MACMTQETILELSRREALHLGDMEGCTLECTHGEIWLTRDGVQEDLILRAGEGARLPDARSVVVSATAAARLRIRRPAACLAGIGGASGRFAARLNRWRIPVLAAMASTALR
ncbi:MAG: DUF2917 domain-containing protein [Rhodocyclaceae bacterium]|nr:DUF2917 domain-containing protein [Rhodocyclaceae bacterium]